MVSRWQGEVHVVLCVSRGSMVVLRRPALGEKRKTLARDDGRGTHMEGLGTTVVSRGTERLGAPRTSAMVSRVGEYMQAVT